MQRQRQLRMDGPWMHRHACMQLLWKCGPKRCGCKPIGRRGALRPTRRPQVRIRRCILVLCRQWVRLCMRWLRWPTRRVGRRAGGCVGGCVWVLLPKTWRRLRLRLRLRRWQLRLLLRRRRRRLLRLLLLLWWLLVVVVLRLLLLRRLRLRLRLRLLRLRLRLRLLRLRLLRLLRLALVHLAQMQLVKRLKWPADRVRIATPVLVACKALAALAIAILTPGHPARRRSRRRRRAGRWLRHAKRLHAICHVLSKRRRRAGRWLRGRARG